MSVEKNVWDKRLTQNLYWDASYRSAFAVLPLISALYAVVTRHSEPLGDFVRGNLGRTDLVLSTVGVLALLMAVVAVMYKDLEAHHPDAWGQHRWRGKIGAFVRSAAGLLTMLMSSAFVSLLLLGICVGFTGINTSREWGYYAAAMAMVMATLVFSFSSYVVVRREGALASGKLVQTPGRIIGFYVTVLVIAVVGVALRLNHLI